MPEEHLCLVPRPSVPGVPPTSLSAAPRLLLAQGPSRPLRRPRRTVLGQVGVEGRPLAVVRHGPAFPFRTKQRRVKKRFPTTDVTDKEEPPSYSFADPNLNTLIHLSRITSSKPVREGKGRFRDRPERHFGKRHHYLSSLRLLVKV